MEVKVKKMVNQQLSAIDLAYLAGFIDADGAIIAQLVYRKDYVLKFQIRLTVQITQSTKRRWLLERFKQIIGAGTLRDRNDRNKVSDWALVEAEQVTRLLTLLEPYLLVKKKQANIVLKIIEQLPTVRGSREKFCELCLLVDQVSELNDANKRKHTAASVTEILLGLKDSDVPVETLGEANESLDDESLDTASN